MTRPPDQTGFEADVAAMLHRRADDITGATPPLPVDHGPHLHALATRGHDRRRRAIAMSVAAAAAVVVGGVSVAILRSPARPRPAHVQTTAPRPVDPISSLPPGWSPATAPRLYRVERATDPLAVARAYLAQVFSNGSRSTSPPHRLHVQSIRGGAFPQVAWRFGDGTRSRGIVHLRTGKRGIDIVALTMPGVSLREVAAGEDSVAGTIAVGGRYPGRMRIGVEPFGHGGTVDADVLSPLPPYTTVRGDEGAWAIPTGSGPAVVSVRFVAGDHLVGLAQVRVDQPEGPAPDLGPMAPDQFVEFLHTGPSTVCRDLDRSNGRGSVPFDPAVEAHEQAVTGEAQSAVGALGQRTPAQAATRWVTTLVPSGARLSPSAGVWTPIDRDSGSWALRLPGGQWVDVLITRSPTTGMWSVVLAATADSCRQIGIGNVPGSSTRSRVSFSRIAGAAAGVLWSQQAGGQVTRVALSPNEAKQGLATVDGDMRHVRRFAVVLLDREGAPISLQLTQL